MPEWSPTDWPNTLSTSFMPPISAKSIGYTKGGRPKARPPFGPELFHSFTDRLVVLLCTLTCSGHQLFPSLTSGSHECFAIFLGERIQKFATILSELRQSLFVVFTAQIGSKRAFFSLRCCFKNSLLSILGQVIESALRSDEIQGMQHIGE